MPDPRPTPTLVDLSALAPRIGSIIALLVRDAALLNACESGSVEYHDSRSGHSETVRPKIPLHPGNTACQC